MLASREEGRTLTFLQRDVAGRSVQAAKINRSLADLVRANFREAFRGDALNHHPLETYE